MVFVVVGLYQGVRVFVTAFVRVVVRVFVSAVSCFTKACVRSVPIGKFLAQKMGIGEPLWHNYNIGLRAPSSNFLMMGYEIACSPHTKEIKVCVSNEQ